MAVVTFGVLPVYPRVCGGTTHSAKLPQAVQGLSPRVRGNPPTSHNVVLTIRSIPACAGEPLLETMASSLCHSLEPMLETTDGGNTESSWPMRSLVVSHQVDAIRIYNVFRSVS